MSIHLATRTLDAINTMLEADQGATYRGYLGRVLPHIGDAYRTDAFPFRTHLGASGVGMECARAIWYGFRWATLPHFEGRILRLFNRGHLEEGRFIALLLSIGAEVYQQDRNGKQFKISDAEGHFGGSGDGVVVGLLDLDAGTPALGEFKTSAEKPFIEVQKKGVYDAKFEHYVQQQIYMRKMGLAISLYAVVNKNTDQLYMELVPLNTAIADEFIQRGVNLVWQTDPPAKLHSSPGWHKCRFCDHRPVCHLNASPHFNCRTCQYSSPAENATWICGNARSPQCGALSKEEQFAGCCEYSRAF